MSTDNSRPNAYAGVAVALVLMSTGPTILRAADSTGLTFAAWRMAAGALVYYGYLRVQRGAVTLAALRSAALGGVLFSGDIALGYIAVANTSIANAVVIITLRPAAVMLLAGPIFRERVSARTAGWILVAITGVVVAVLGSGTTGDNALKGDVIAVGAMLSSAGYLMVSKHTRVRFDTMTYSTSMMIVAALTLVPIAIIADRGVDPPPTGDWIWIAAMVLVPGVGHVLTNYAHEYVNITLLSSVFLVLPGMSTFIAWIFVDEVVKPTHVIGMAVTIIGLAMVVINNESKPQPGTERVSDA